MEYLNLLGKHETHNGLRPFAKAFFDALKITNGEERESGNYVDGYYLKGSYDGLVFTVALSDEDAHDDLPYWVHISTDAMESDVLTTSVEQLIRALALPAGFRFAHIVNFGKRGEQRIDY